MMQTVQLILADGVFAATVREALSRSCACHVEYADRPDLARPCVLVLDEFAFARLPLPLPNPERIVLISRKEHALLARAWEAGIVSVVSAEDPMSTILLAIMSASLRIVAPTPAKSSGISPNYRMIPASLAPENRSLGPSKRCKTP